MRARQFSLSAVGAAGHRAMHQRLEGGRIFADPFARDILDDDELRAAEDQAAAPAGRPMRLFMAARSRLAEDTIAAAVARTSKPCSVRSRATPSRQIGWSSTTITEIRGSSLISYPSCSAP